MNRIHSYQCPICNNPELIPILECKDHFVSQEVFTICECNVCKFRLTQDFPDQMEMGKYNDIEQHISHPESHKGITQYIYHLVRKKAIQSKVKIVKEYADASQGMLLDIEANKGYFANKAKEQRWVVTGVEQSEAARKYANTKFGIHLQEFDYLYQLMPNSKDVITMWHVLEHTQNLSNIMHRCHEILKPNGTLFVALQNTESYDAEMYQSDWAAYDVPRRMWHFSPDNFALFAKKYNFEVIATHSMHLNTLYISMLSEKIRGTSCASIVGLLKGYLYLIKSLKHKNRSSSVIYILKKQQVNN